jgi:hypothetical protein
MIDASEISGAFFCLPQRRENEEVTQRFVIVVGWDVALVFGIWRRSQTGA